MTRIKDNRDSLLKKLLNLNCDYAIIDFDGVIVNSEPIHDLSYKYTLYKVGIDADQFDFKKYVGNNEKTIWAKISQDYPIINSVDELYEIRNDFVNELVLKQKPNWFIITILEFFKDRNGSVLVSSGNGNVINSFLDKWELDKYFNAKYMSTNMHKPIDKPFILSLEIKKCKENVVVLEDSVTHAIHSKENGSKVIWVEHSINSNNLELITKKKIDLIIK